MRNCEVTKKSRPNPEPKLLHQAAYQVLRGLFLKLPRGAPCQGGPPRSHPRTASHSEKLPQRVAFGGGKQSPNPPKITPRSSPGLEPHLRKTAVPRLIRNPPLTSPKGCLWLRSASPKSRSPAGLLTVAEFLRRFAQQSEDSTKARGTKLELFFSVHRLFTDVKNR